MHKKQRQLELFNTENERIRFKSIPKDFPVPAIKNKPQIQPHIFIGLASVLLILITTFALGIERGRTISGSQVSQEMTISKIEPPEIITTAPKLHSINSNPVKIVAPTETKKKLAKSAKNDKLSNPQYIIQVVTYKRDSSYVRKEINTLKEKGYDPFVKKSGDYIVICTGEYQNKKEAQAQLRKLQQTYKDCFIKKI